MGTCQSQEEQQELSIENQNHPQKLQNKLHNLNAEVLPNNNNNNINSNNNSNTNSGKNSSQLKLENPYNFQQSTEVNIQQQKEQLLQKQRNEFSQLKQQTSFLHSDPKEQERQLKLLQEQHEIEMETFLQESAMQYDQITNPGLQSNQLQNSQANSAEKKSINASNDYQYSQAYTEIREIFDFSELGHYYFVTTVFNAVQSKKKQDVYKRFKKMCQDNDINLITVEYTLGGLPFVVTEPNYEPYNFQIRIEEPLSLKYNLINTIIDKLPENWGWLAIVDYNVIFTNLDWIEQCKYNLQRSVAQQLFSFSQPLPYDSKQFQQQQNQMQDSQQDIQQQQDGMESLQKLTGKECLAKHMSAIEVTPDNLSTIVSTFEAGKAWAFRRDFVEVFGLQDFFVTGFEELYFLLCMVGKCSENMEGFFNENVIKFIQGYEQDFDNYQLNFGYLENEINYVVMGNSAVTYGIDDGIQLMQGISDNLQKNENGIFITGNTKLVSRLQDLKESLL